MITLTESASRKMKELIETQGKPDVALRVSVRSGGCCARSYDMFFDTVLGPDDQTAEFAGVKIVVDSTSARFLDGASLDYHEGRLGPSFTINNPSVPSCEAH